MGYFPPTRGRGRGWRRGRGARFSTVSRAELGRLYNSTYTDSTIPMVDKAPTTSALVLISQLRGKLTDRDWTEVSDAYTALFSTGLPDGHCEIPPLLRPIFKYLRVGKAGGVNVFSNGAGKLLMFHLFTLLPLDMASLRISTTSDPRHDWCGINLPNISGVVDAALVHDRKWLVVGEVKGDGSLCVTQVLAAMQAKAGKDQQYPYGKQIL